MCQWHHAWINIISFFISLFIQMCNNHIYKLKSFYCQICNYKMFLPSAMEDIEIIITKMIDLDTNCKHINIKCDFL
jgi:hypothetical protein